MTQSPPLPNVRLPHRHDAPLPASEQTPAQKKNLRRAGAAGLIGTALEQYDFIIYGTATAIVFNEIFFSSLTPAMGFIAAFGTYAVGFGARPLGGLFFSRIGDRIGRKAVMVSTLFIMGVATFLIGVLPTYEQVGILAPLLLVACRFLQGFGAGAEQASGVVLLAETAGPGRRGRFSSLVFVGSALGTALGAIVWILVQLMPREDLLSYGWRLVFLSSIFVTIGAFIIRIKMAESPVFEQLKAEGTLKDSKPPISDVVKNGRPNLTRVFFLNLGPNGFSYIVQVFMGSYLISRIGMDPTLIPKILLAGAVAGMVSAFAFGALSDIYGRRRVYLIVTGLLLFYPVAAFATLSTGNVVAVGAVIVVGFILAAYGAPGVSAPYFPELFGSRYRYAGVTLGREFSSVLGGGIAPLVCSALIAWATGSWWPVAIYMTAIMLISFVTALRSPETRDRDMLDESDARL
ncbi:MFS transporter [Rhodococcus sp. 06-412-2C]|uniref:MFS transporter n=1 Tax=unclassified Rhodococcus (in: high G+C Gram-positive bacteria) TaxID=192944 RepID=UPI000B9B239E|nr:MULTISPECIES: MFS transporter [unclassified Rhodococcus (in: high G+C Gram-positive bacteria)]OZC83987.1 MFS transporter [Rhodococcus sp. 06-412-2C]OZC94173.1 MFS transporter [Rhodococcus sp. 06-412-2B]